MSIQLPGFVDLHVHFREPGFSSKETIRTGTAAAARGGYAAVCAMPNLDPAPDSLAHLREQLDVIARDASEGVTVIPVGAITKGQAGRGALSDMAAMAPYVCGFSDDGRGIQEDDLMRAAMRTAKALHKPIIAHCEDERLPGDCSESEWKQLARDLALVKETGCAYHMCHVSAKESVGLLRAAKREGLPVTAETAPHYLLLTKDDVLDDGRFKMNPPLRTREDREALLEALRDGTIDCVATDHAPHTREEKSRGFAGSAFGIVGLETAFPVLYTHLVRENVLTLETLVHLMSRNPHRLLEAWTGRKIPLGHFTWDLDRQYTVDPENFLSMGRATPFAGWPVFGQCTIDNLQCTMHNEQFCEECYAAN